MFSEFKVLKERIARLKEIENEKEKLFLEIAKLKKELNDYEEQILKERKEYYTIYQLEEEQNEIMEIVIKTLINIFTTSIFGGLIYLLLNPTLYILIIIYCISLIAIILKSYANYRGTKKYYKEERLKKNALLLSLLGNINSLNVQQTKIFRQKHNLEQKIGELEQIIKKEQTSINERQNILIDKLGPILDELISRNMTIESFDEVLKL